jgi:hypothetical protein
MRWIAIRLLALALAALVVACAQSSLPTQPTSSLVTPRLVTFAGVISESEANAPLAGVSVCFPLSNCALTGADGSYHFTVDPAALSFPIGSNTSLCPYAYLDGYEQRGACVPLINNRISWSATLQRTITLAAGRRVRSTVFKGEGNGLVGLGLVRTVQELQRVGAWKRHALPERHGGLARVQGAC